MLVGLTTIPIGSGDITDAIASAFGIRRFQAERLKCVNGSAIASPADHREMIPINAPARKARPAASWPAMPMTRTYPARRTDQRHHHPAWTVDG
jgi:hypothetical protein